MTIARKHVLAAAFAECLRSGWPMRRTPDRVDTRIGPLNFENGYPTEETARKLYDEMDFQRAVQTFLWSFPAVSFESIRLGLKQDLGADLDDMVIADNFSDPKGVWFTANDTTIYGGEHCRSRQGRPVVVESRPGLPSG